MTVEPIREINKINRMYCYLETKDPKYGLMFKVGLNTGLRISDILPLRTRDIFNSDGSFRDHLILNEKKTGKEKKIKINAALRKEILMLVPKGKSPENAFLFRNPRTQDHIQRIQAYKVLKSAAKECGIENFGTHSMRKTWGYWTYRASKYNIGLIMDTFNHSSPSVTLRYIGVNQDQKDKLYTMVQF
jgi:integrase